MELQAKFWNQLNPNPKTTPKQLINRQEDSFQFTLSLNSCFHSQSWTIYMVVVDHIWRTHPGQKANPVKKFDAPLPSSAPQIETFQIQICPLKKIDKYVLESRSNF